MEIERKFLVPATPPFPAGTAVLVRQGYLATGPEGEVRLRDAGGSLTLTVKSGTGMVRGEFETPLSAEQFAALWPATEGARVEKWRTRVPLTDLVAELDVYGGDLAGLTVAEVEFVSVEQAEAFVAPDWFGLDVTADPVYKNASLAYYGLPQGAPSWVSEGDLTL